MPRPPRSTLSPYTTLFRSRCRRGGRLRGADMRRGAAQVAAPLARTSRWGGVKERRRDSALPPSHASNQHSDRKSTRLNSSHLVISYAVFCLKKKKEKRRRL